MTRVVYVGLAYVGALNVAGWVAGMSGWLAVVVAAALAALVCWRA